MQKQGQKHQNKKAFKLKYKEKQIEQGKVAPLDRLCEKCLELIKWKIQYGKYKVPTQWRKCVKCEEKNVHKAYRVVCNKCSDKYKICSKCCEAKQLMKEPEKEGVDYKLLQVMEKYMEKLRERSKRTLLRKINDKLVTWDGEQFIYKSSKLPVENMQFKKNKDDSDEESESEGDSGSQEEDMSDSESDNEEESKKQ